MSYEFLKTKAEDGIVRITLNRPPVNVLNIPMMEEMVEAFKWAKDQEGCLVVVDAEGKAFSAGVDVGDHTPEKVDKMIDVFDRLFEAMNEVEKPIVAVVQGAALGGGYEVVLYCDLVVASEKASFGQPEIQVGVFPPPASYALPRMLTWPKAMELLLSGDTINATRAEELGLVNTVLPADNFAEGAEDYLKKYTKLSPVVLSLTKKAVKAGLNKDFKNGIKEIDSIYLNELMKTEDAVEGLNAFMEKRKPEWKGK